MLQSDRRTRRPQRLLSRKPRVSRLEILEERQLLAGMTFPVTSVLGDTSANTLYAAIAASNAHDPGPGGHNTITFDIANTGVPQSINLEQALPAIAFPVTIDGTSEPEFKGTPLIFVNGTTAGSGASGFVINASGTTIEALGIGNFNSSGILVNTATVTNTLIEANYIGVDSTGSTAQPNGDGVTIDNSSGNTITGMPFVVNGATIWLPNVISASTFDEVDFSDSKDNLVQGNYIGTNAAGTKGLDRGWDGIKFTDSSSNTIGGIGANLGNVISGGGAFDELQFTTFTGVTTDNLAIGNFIGTNAAGTAAALPLAGGVSSNGVLLDGAGTTGNTVGGTAAGAGNVISGNNEGVQFNASGNTVIGNYIGTNATGTAAIPNADHGVEISEGNVTLGGTAAGAGNLISGNGSDGVATPFLNSGGIQIEGNFIGTDYTGLVAIPNGTADAFVGAGVIISGGTGVTVGGTTSGARNIISGNVNAGVYVTGGTGVAIEGNYIGTGVNGTSAVGNDVGILLNGGSEVVVGGTTLADQNVISGNVAANGFQGAGIEVSSSAGGNLFAGNLIGTDVTGTVAIPNAGNGIMIGGSSTGDTIGGTASGDGNVISGNFGNGIQTFGSATELTVQGNEIGTSIPDPVTGDVAALGNGGDGVQLQTSNNLVGGSVANAGNVIAFNGTVAPSDGIHLVNLNNPPTGDVLEQNSIYGNSALGISLSNAGIVPTPIGLPATPADPYANNHNNYPTINQAITNAGVTTVSGLLTAEKANTVYTIEFFQSSSTSPAGYGQGETLIGTLSNVQTDSSGSASFTTVLNNPAILAGDTITATTTDASLQDGTSEFSKDVAIQGLVDVSLSVTANPTTVYVGQTVTYSVTITNNGTTAAHSVTINDTLPNNISPVVKASDPLGTTVINGGTVTDSIPVLQPGVSTTLTITVTPTQLNVPSMTDSAFVTTTDENTDNNTAGAANVVVKPVVPLKLTLTPNPDPALVGQTLSYVATLQNLNTATAATGVVFTDTLDPNETFNATTSSAGLSLSGTTLTDTIGTIAGGQKVTITINVTPNPSAINPATDSGSLTENASEAYNESVSDPNDPNAPQSVSVTTPVNPVADLSVGFLPLPTPNPAPVDQPLTYTIVVTNNGPSTANDIVLTDVLDPNVTFVAGSSTPGWSASGQTLTMDISQLDSGNSTNLTVVVTPNAAAVSPITDAGSVANTASVTAHEADLTQANNSATVNVAVTPVAMLAVSGSATPNPVAAGTDLVYTFTVTNAGPSTANDVLFTDPIPVNETYVSALSSQGLPPSALNNTITANLGTLVPGASALVTITVQPTGKAGNVGSVSNTASVTADETGGVSTQSTPVVTTVTPSADVSVSIQASPSPVLIGTELTYVITASNAGPSDASDVTLSDTLAAGVVVNSINPSQGAYSTAGQVISANLGVIAAGGSATLTIIVTPQSTSPVADSVTVSNSPEPDPNLANNSTSITTQVTPSADLKIQLVGTPNPVLSGTDLLYTATVTNNGPSTATGVTINDTIPIGATLVSVLPSIGGSYSQTGAVVTGSFPSLAAGASASVTIDVVPAVRGTLIDTATVQANEFDANLANNSTSVSTNVEDLPGTFDFLNSSYTVNNNAGFATVTVVRTDGLQGDVKVQYSTTSGSAKPGLDYTATTGTLDFPDGVSMASFTVPVLAYAFNRGDVAVGLALSNPQGGAVLGPQYGALLTIHVLNPDVTPPTVTDITWTGVGQSRSTIDIDFSKPMAPSTVTNISNYQLVSTGASSIFGASGNSNVRIASATYNATNNSVVLVTATPLRPNVFYHLDINGSTGSPVTDIVGNPLAGNGAAGTDNVLFFATGSNLTYIDAGANRVNLRIAGGGTLNLTRFPSGEGENLQIVGEVPHRSRLVGTIRPVGRVGGTGTTSFNAITGLGNFGDVRVQMSTPPFFVTVPSFASSGSANTAAIAHDAVPATAATHVQHAAVIVETKALHRQRGGAFAKTHR